MLAAAKIADGLPSLTNITTESLAYVYENTLVSEEVRDALGTHRTPSWLVDYIVWQLAPWIEEMPADDRHVLEPSCGHSPFLVAAVRLLRQLASSELDEPARLRYLRSHIQCPFGGQHPPAVRCGGQGLLTAEPGEAGDR